MTPNKNEQVIFAIHSEKIDQPEQVAPTELLQNTDIVSSMVGTPPPPPFSEGTPLFLKQI